MKSVLFKPNPLHQVYYFCILVLALLCSAPANAQDERFNIVRFNIVGNTLLPASEMEKLVAPMIGQGKVYGDIQKALEAIEGAYRQAGWSTVDVHVPEQELTEGVIRIDVTENVIGKVEISGNTYFDNANIRAGLVALKEGKVPNLREMSEGIQLSNENPAKQLEVTLGAGEEEGQVDAKILVTEENPKRVYMTLDDTGTVASGRTRIGIAYQNANVFNRDQTMTLAYTTSPESPRGVQVDIFSFGYRVPFYTWGDSLDIIYGKSSSNTPSNSPTLGGALGITSKGDVFGLRWNHYFPRRGEYAGKLIAGLDYKYINARCNAAGIPVSIEPPTPPISSCVPYTSRPMSLTYTGAKTSPGQIFDYSLGIARNWPMGSQYVNTTGEVDRFSYLTSGNRPTTDEFTILRFSGTYLKAFENDWQVRVAGNSQYSAKPMLAAEQFGLAGSTAVRGFNERAVAADKGFLINTELNTPELASSVGMPGNLRGVLFYDFARGFNNNSLIAGAAVVPEKVGIATVGFGLRYSAGKRFSLRADFAHVLDGGPLGSQARGDQRAHFSAMIGF